MSTRNLNPKAFSSAKVGEQFYVGAHSYTLYEKVGCGQAIVIGSADQTPVTFSDCYTIWN